MHILQCYKTARPLTMGGVEQIIHHISQGLIEKGHQATVLAFAPQKKSEVLSYEGYEVVVVPATREIASMPISLKSFPYYKKLCRQADVIHYHHPFPWIDFVHLICPHQKASVLTYQSDIIKQKKLLKLYQPLQKYFLNQMSSIVSTSPNYLGGSETLQKFSSKLSTIPLGLDEGLYKKPNDAVLGKWKELLPNRFLLFIGVFRYYKGLKFLFEAMQGLDYPLVLIGDGPEKQELLMLQKKYHLKNIIFLGRLNDEDKIAVLTHCAGLVLPSHLRSEAFGLSLVEGAMFGKPLISCEIGTGTSFINQNHHTGWVVEPANSQSLKQALRAWHQDEVLANKYGKNARIRYENLFQARNMVESYLKLYQSVFNQKKL